MEGVQDQGRAENVVFDAVDVDAPLARRAVAHYFAELQRRFSEGFDAEAESAKDASGLRPPGGIFVVATIDGGPVACGGIQSLGDQVAEVKRMWVDPNRRGRGLGSRLLQHLEARAVELGHRRIRLDTNAGLHEAIALYRRSGYREIAAYNDNPYAALWFEKWLS